jgi:hypothetical protein
MKSQSLSGGGFPDHLAGLARGVFVWPGLGANEQINGHPATIHQRDDAESKRLTTSSTLGGAAGCGSLVRERLSDLWLPVPFSPRPFQSTHVLVTRRQNGKARGGARTKEVIRSPSAVFASLRPAAEEARLAPVSNCQPNNEFRVEAESYSMDSA